MKRPAIDRFTEKHVNTPSGCWLWTAAVNEFGYGWFTLNRTQHTGAHRWSYEYYVGPIPHGLTLDHLCHTNDTSCSGGVTCQHRRCVNPAHLEPVTTGENQRRGVRATAPQCTNGHDYTVDNTYHRPNGGRGCRRCRADACVRYERRKQATRSATAVELSATV